MIPRNNMQFLISIIASVFTFTVQAQDEAKDSLPAKSYFKTSVNYLTNSIYYGRKD